LREVDDLGRLVDQDEREGERAEDRPIRKARHELLEELLHQ